MIKKIVFGFLWMLFLPLLGYSQLDSLKTSVFPDDGPTPYDMNGFTFNPSYVPSNSYWAAVFPETEVYHSLFKYEHSSNPDKSYELRIGKGGNIYSFIGSFGESVPPQYPAHAPWVDEVWQMVAVDGNLNLPAENKSHFIHQAGVYLRTPEQTQPFYSPMVAEYINLNEQSYTTVNWGQQAHTSDNLNSGYTSTVLYYNQYKNLGEGIIQVDYLMYNYGEDTITFINIPWGGVRRSTFDHFFASLPDHSYFEETGTFTSYTENLINTGGWAAFSSDPLGNAPSLALIMDNDEGVLRLGDAGTIANRDYTVFEGIKFPGTDLNPGKAIRARNYYILDSHLDSIQATIINEDLGNKTVYEPFNKLETEVDSTAYVFEYQNNELIAIETTFAEGMTFKLRPYLNSYPVFINKSTSGEFRITTDLYTFSPYPYDGAFESAELLGYLDNPTQIKMETSLICSGEDFTYPDGTIATNITSTDIHLSHMGMTSNGYDSLIYTTIYVEPSDVAPTEFIPNGPAGVGGTNGGSSLQLWLDAKQLMGDSTSNPANGSLVDQWLDLSGNSNHYSSTGLNRPTYNTTTFPAVHFDATTTDPQFLMGTEENLSYGSVFFALNATDVGMSNSLLSNASFRLKYEQSNNSGFLGFSEVGGTNYTSSLSSVYNTENIISFEVDCADDQLRIYSQNQNENLTIGNVTDGIPLGELGTATDRISGNFYEIIAFDQPINTAQKLLIDNYLSAKYGSSLISNDIYIQDELANGNFDFDVAGIGRMDANNEHINARGTGVVQVENPSQLDDGEFLIWGNNGLDLEFSVNTDVPNYILAKTERVWRLSEVNLSLNPIDVGTIDMSFDVSTTNIAEWDKIVLLVDTNNDGNFADEIYLTPQEIKTEFEGQAILQFNGLNVENGNRFCLAKLTPKAPGGVYQGLALWLSTDGIVNSIDGSTVNQWIGRSPNKHTATGVGPVISNDNADLLNYHPVMRLDGVDDRFAISGGILKTNSYNDMNIFIVSRLNAAPHQSTIIRENVVGGSISSHLPWSSGAVFWDAGLGSGDGRLSVGSGLAAGDDAFWGLLSHNGATDEQTIRRNGKTLKSDNTALNLTGVDGDMQIGAAGAGLYYNGDIIEVIAYLGNNKLTDIPLRQIESYLALKYAYTLDNSLGGSNGDYLNSSSDVLWDADLYLGYHHDVIGITRDDASFLHQKQSKTRDDSLHVFIDQLAASNAENTTDITRDLSSIVIGHNQSRLYDSNPGSGIERPVSVFARLDREWKIENTNFIDPFSLKIELENGVLYDINDLRLLVDEDGDFSNAQIIGSPDVEFSEGSIIVSGINPSIIPLNSTRFITIASIDPNTPLPVELVAFEAKAIREEVHLDWETASEENFEAFVVERSKTGIEWESLEEIKGRGNVLEGQLYQRIDNNPYAGTSYYRLKIKDKNGIIDYSKTETIKIRRDQATILVYPIPSKDKIMIEGSENELEELNIYNMMGENVTPFVPFHASASIKELNISSLPEGVYWLKTKTSWVKFIKL